MIKKLLILTLMGVSFNCVYANLQYDPNDVNKLKKDGVCEKCDLSALEWNLNGDIDISGSNIVGSKFGFAGNLNLQHSKFDHVIATNSILYYDDLSEVSFSGATLINVNFYNSTLSNTDFSGANVSGANFNNTILVGSNITPEQLKTASSYCDAVMPDGTIHKC